MKLALNILSLSLMLTGAAHAQGSGPITTERLTIIGPGSTGDVSAMSVKIGDTAILRTLSSYLADLPISVAAFGAKGDGSVDDAPAINKAVQFACARKGGIVQLMRLHRIGATIDNNCSGVLVRGIGGEDSPHDINADTPFGTIVFPVPGFQGDALAHRTRTASEQGVSAANNPAITGGGFVGITASRFKRNLHVTSTRRATYKLNLLDACGTESALFDSLPDYRQGARSQMGEYSDIQGMDLAITFRQQADAATDCTSAAADGVVFTAYPGAGNSSYNFGMKLNGAVVNGVGWRSISSDNNVWENFRIGVASGGTGKPFVIQASVAGQYTNDTNIFRHYQSNKPGYVEGPGDRPNGIAPLQTTIDVLDISNSSAVPTAGAGTTLAIVNGYRRWTTDWTPTITAASGTITGGDLAGARYRRDVLGGTIYFTTTFSAQYTTASGALGFTLPFPVLTTTVFAGRESSTGWAMSCVVGDGSSQANCLRSNGTTPLVASGNFFTVSGTYEIAQ